MRYIKNLIRCQIAFLAQLVEHVICNLKVVGSSPTEGSRKYRGVEQLEACQAHNLKVGGSSPSPATK